MLSGYRVQKLLQLAFSNYVLLNINIESFIAYAIQILLFQFLTCCDIEIQKTNKGHKRE